jgi:hypothetical protein
MSYLDLANCHLRYKPKPAPTLINELLDLRVPKCKKDQVPVLLRNADKHSLPVEILVVMTLH